MSEASPTEITLAARALAHRSWAATTDRRARMAKVWEAREARWVRLADPEGVLSPEDRAAKAASLRAAFYAEITRKSLASRRAKREASN